jgi:hypothetical protein
MSQAPPFEPPLSARRAAIFRQADDARRIAESLQADYRRLRAMVEEDPYRRWQARRSTFDGRRRGKAED